MGSPLTHRALVAVLLMVGFYALMLALAAGILALLGVYVYYVFVYGQDFDVPEEALLFAAALAGGILWSLLPQLDHFDPPGPPLAAQEHPRLFAILQELTAATGQAMPRKVYLVPGTLLWVESRGGAMGLGSRRVMAVGLLLLQQLTVAQLRGVLASELALFHRGGVALGPWVQRTRAVLERNRKGLAMDPWAFPVLFEHYAALFGRITDPVAHGQQLHADALAASLVGRSTLADGLLALERWGAIQAAYLEDEVNPVLRAGFRPPIAEGFRRTMQAAAAKDEASAEETAPPPPLGARLAALAERPEGPSPTPAEQESAITLLDDLDGAEAALVSHMRSAFTYRMHELIAWEEVDARLHAKRSTQTSPRSTKRSTSSTSARRGRRSTGRRRRGRPNPDGS